MFWGDYCNEKYIKISARISLCVLCGFPGVESFSLSEPAAPVVLGGTDYIVPTYDIVPEWVP